MKEIVELKAKLELFSNVCLLQEAQSSHTEGDPLHWLRNGQILQKKIPTAGYY